MGDATKNRYDPVIRHLRSLREECQQKGAPEYVVTGLDKTLDLIAARDKYCESTTSEPSDALKNIASGTWDHPWKQVHEEGKTKWNFSPMMMSGGLEGQFLQTLVSMQKAKRVLELGMYTGYSALACSEVLPEDGEVVTCEVDPYLEGVAKEFFAKSPHGRKIQIRLGPAKDTLLNLVKEKQTFDVVFIDADKPSYKEYYQIIMGEGLLNKGGTVIFDNALFGGWPYSEDCTKEKSPMGWGVKQSNDFVAADTRVHRVLVPLRDGILIVRRKEEIDTMLENLD